MLFITQLLTHTAQYEKLYLAALMPAIKLAVYKKLTADTIMVVDMANPTSSPNLPRKEMSVDELTDAGGMSRWRAIVEFERRFLGSNLEVPVSEVSVLPGAPQPKLDITMNDRQLVATLLDVRTKHAAHLTREQKRQAQNALRELYVKFAVQKGIYERKEAEKTKAAASAEEHPPSPTRSPAKKKSRSEVPKKSPLSELSAPRTGADDDGFDFVSSDEESDGDQAEEDTEETLQKKDADAAMDEFPRVFKRWFKLEVPWQSHFPDLPKDPVSVPLNSLHEASHLIVDSRS